MFFSFYFLNALQSDINSNRVYVLGHKYVLGPSQAHFSPRLAARAKMSLSRAQNIFMPANINSIVILLFKFRRHLCKGSMGAPPRLGRVLGRVHSSVNGLSTD